MIISSFVAGFAVFLLHELSGGSWERLAMEPMLSSTL